MLMLILLPGIVLVERYVWLSLVNRLAGILLIVIAVRIWRERGHRSLGPEFLLTGGFILWAGLTGLLLSPDPEVYWGYLSLAAQCWALGVVAMIITMEVKSPSLVLGPVLVAGMVLFVYSFRTGELQDVRYSAYDRAVSLVTNPNFLGIVSLYCIAAIAIMWRDAKLSRAMRAIIALSLPSFIFLLLSSASRKAAASLILFALLWFVLCGKLMLRGSLVGRVAALVVVSSVGVLAARYAPNVLQKRVERSLADDRVDETRVDLILAAWRLTKENPIAGVGLGGYRTRSGMGITSHSEYAEVLSTTGFVGGALYFGAYVAFIRRLRRLKPVLRTRADQYKRSAYFATVLSMLALAIGVPNFLSPLHWAILGAMTGSLRGMARIGTQGECIPKREHEFGRSVGGNACR